MSKAFINLETLEISIDFLEHHLPDDTYLTGETEFLKGEIITHTEKAVLFNWSGFEKWFPKSRINVVSDQEIEVESWLLEDLEQ